MITVTALVRVTDGNQEWCIVNAQLQVAPPRMAPLRVAPLRVVPL